MDTIEYLENYLSKQRCTLLMVTHDRYFLDRVCNQIIEMADGTLYTYNGNYSYFLEKREERLANTNAQIDRARNLLRGELEWMRRTPSARTGKAKYRIDSFYDLQERAQQKIVETNMTINVGMARLGKKVINCKNLSFSWENWIGLKDFTYNYIPGEKIGVVGNNGVGKSTFLNLMTGNLNPSGGEIEIGETIRFGYYRQEGISFNPNDTVIDAVREIAEVVTLEDGKSVPVSTFLNYFLFPPHMHYTKIEKLSGGEKRRLYLMTVLMRQPNFLILDEPTNDLDISTLQVLEDYLADFKGCVIVVSHDRYFMDKVVDHLLVFKGGGDIKDFPGNYSQYREWNELQESETEKEQQKKKEDTAQKAKAQSQSNRKRKLTFAEKNELARLEEEIETLEEEKSRLETELCSGTLSVEDLTKYSKRLPLLQEELDDKSMRWLELCEIDG
jgi:ATP-binding cassette subfamily F protein uup